MEYFLIIAVIFIFQYNKMSNQRRDVVANYRTAERFGRHRLQYSEFNKGIIFENDPYRIQNWDYRCEAF